MTTEVGGARRGHLPARDLEQYARPAQRTCKEKMPRHVLRARGEGRNSGRAVPRRLDRERGDECDGGAGEGRRRLIGRGPGGTATSAGGVPGRVEREERSALRGMRVSGTGRKGCDASCAAPSVETGLRRFDPQGRTRGWHPRRAGVPVGGRRGRAQHRGHGARADRCRRLPGRGRVTGRRPVPTSAGGHRLYVGDRQCRRAAGLRRAGMLRAPLANSGRHCLRIGRLRAARPAHSYVGSAQHSMIVARPAW